MRGLFLLVVVLVSVITSAATVIVIERFQLMAPDKVPVPTLVGLTEEDAKENLKAVGLVFMLTARKPSAEAETGTVIEQALPPGHPASRGAPIGLTIAVGLPKVPKLVGLSLADAKTAVAASGFALKEGEPVFPDADAGADAGPPPGQVIEQDPAAETTLEKGKPITVRVSTAAEEVMVPKLLGQSVNQVKETLKQAGLELGVVWIEQAETPSYVVLNQKPAPDTKVKPGEKVVVTVNR